MESGVVLYLLYFVLDVSTPKSNDRPPSGPIKIIAKLPKKIFTEDARGYIRNRKSQDRQRNGQREKNNGPKNITQKLRVEQQDPH